PLFNNSGPVRAKKSRTSIASSAVAGEGSPTVSTGRKGYRCKALFAICQPLNAEKISAPVSSYVMRLIQFVQITTTPMLQTIPVSLKGSDAFFRSSKKLSEATAG